MSTQTELAQWLAADALEAHHVTLPSGQVVEYSRLLRHEHRLPEPIARTESCWAPNKPTVDFEGTPTWAELVIVRLLERQGWEARWLKNWTGGREMCVDVGRARPLPQGVGDMLGRIDRRAAIATGGGAWDILAWRDSEYLCIESKQHRSSDRLRSTQLAWLEAAIAEGIDGYAIVEYEAPLIGSPPPARSSAPSPPAKRAAKQRTGVLDATFAAAAPRGQGCEWLTRAGQPCQNPANYRVEGRWSCSRDHRR